MMRYEVGQRVWAKVSGNDTVQAVIESVTQTGRYRIRIADGYRRAGEVVTVFYIDSLV